MANGSDLNPASVMERLVQSLKKLPGIGEKTATRLAFYILRQPESFAMELADGIMDARQRLHSCSQCCNFSEQPTCAICANPQRSDEIICVVEEPSDLTAFEKSRQFTGKYHVLHGAISPLDGIDEGKLRIRQLQERVQSGLVKEVILATNPTVEGDTTALYIARLIKYNGVKVSRIAHGIPVGAEIEYLDGATLGKALQNRVAL
jgi:recombination protein RecR